MVMAPDALAAKGMAHAANVVDQVALRPKIVKSFQLNTSDAHEVRRIKAQKRSDYRASFFYGRQFAPKAELLRINGLT
jgi:hypothetical protein